MRIKIKLLYIIIKKKIKNNKIDKLIMKYLNYNSKIMNLNIDGNMVKNAYKIVNEIIEKERYYQKCLIKSCIIFALFKNKIPIKYNIGIKKDPFSAHAWIENMVTGESLYKDEYVYDKQFIKLKPIMEVLKNEI